MNPSEMSPTELTREVIRVRQKWAPMLGAHVDQLIARRAREYDMHPRDIIEMAIEHGLENMEPSEEETGE